MPNYQYVCEICDLETTFNHSYEGRPESIPCVRCDRPALYRIGSPSLMQASFPDGTKRKGWDVLKEAAKLNTEAAGEKTSTKKEIQKEIKKLGVRMGKNIT